MPLSPRNLAAIPRISRGNVAATLRGLRPYLHDQKWLGPRNRYARKTISTIKSLPAGALPAPKQLAQYIAASSLLHCADGWSFFGASIASLLRGDPHRTRHLAYYGELRAAMSLLAAFGIGVFNSTHFFIDGKDSVARFPAESTTHRFVWGCIEYLGSRNDLGDLFSTIMHPYGRSLADWLTPVGGALQIAPQARQWFLQWGQDLEMPEKDHDARNESSYRPDGISDAWYLNTAEVLSYVEAIWHALEPSPNSRFEEIDRYILRLAVETSFKAQYGGKRSSRRPTHEEFISRIVDYQSFGPRVAEAWIKFLSRQSSPTDHPILQASRQLPVVRDGSEFAVLARAALLLRAASGSVLQLFSDAGVSIDSIDFWRDALGVGRGLWDTPGNPLDLWADLQSVLDEIASFQTRVPTGDQSFYKLETDLGHVMSGLGCGDRIAIWSMST